MNTDWKKDLDHACLNLRGVMSDLEKLVNAHFVVGNHHLASILEGIHNQVAEAEELIKEANHEAFNTYVDTVNEGTANMLKATLMMCELKGR
jgi:hypothetical protein